MTQNAPKRDKRYNIIGTISGSVIRQDRFGKNYVTFALETDAKPVKCVAFAEHSDELTERFGDGDKVKLFGFYEKRPFTTAQGEQRVSQRFRVLWSDVPSADAEEIGETAEA